MILDKLDAGTWKRLKSSATNPSDPGIVATASHYCDVAVRSLGNTFKKKVKDQKTIYRRTER